MVPHVSSLSQIGPARLLDTCRPLHRRLLAASRRPNRLRASSAMHGAGRDRWIQQLFYLCLIFNDTNGVVTHIIWNACGREPISSSQYRPAGRVSLECLSEKNNFAVPPVRYRVVNRSNAFSSRPCIKSVPSLLQIQMGLFNVTMAPCPWHSPHLEYQAAYLGGCAFTLEKIEDQVLFTWSYNGRSLTRPRGVADDGHVYRFWA